MWTGLKLHCPESPLYLWRRVPMKKMILPAAVFILGLSLAHYVFGFDVPELFRGFGQFLADLFLRGGK